MTKDGLTFKNNVVNLPIIRKSDVTLTVNSKRFKVSVDYSCKNKYGPKKENLKHNGKHTILIHNNTIDEMDSVMVNTISNHPLLFLSVYCVTKNSFNVTIKNLGKKITDIIEIVFLVVT